MATERAARSSDRTRDPDALLTSLAVVASFCAGLSLTLALAIVVVRWGLGTPPRLVALCLAVFLSTAYAPFLLPRRWHSRLANAVFVYPLVSLVVFITPLALSRAGSVFGYLYIPLAAIGLLRARPSLRRASRRQLAILAMAVPVLALHLFVVMNARFAAHAFSPEYARLGILNDDTYFQAAIANMINYLGAASTGLDGLVPIHYHVGSHYWFASMGTMGDASALFTYLLALFVVVPFFFLTLLQAVVCLKDDEHVSATVLVLVTVAIVAIFDALDPTVYYFVSESYAFGLIVLFCTLPLISTLIRRSERASTSGWGPYLLVPLIVVPALAIKAPVGMLLGVAFVYIAFRTRARAGMVVSAVTLAAAAALAVTLFAGDADGGSFAPDPLHYLVVRPGTALIALMLNLSVPVLFVLLMWPGRRLALRRWISDLMARPLSESEVVAVVTLVAVGIVLAFRFSVARGAYFVNFPFWLALPLLIARLSFSELRTSLTQARNVLSNRSLVAALGLVAVIVLVPVVNSLVPRFIPVATEKMLVALREEAETDDGGIRVAASWILQFKESLSSDRALWGSDFRRALNDSYGSRLARTVDELVAEARGRAGVFVPPSNTRFWEYARECRSQPFVIPSVTGVAMLKGVPPAEFGCQVPDYGYDDYSPSARSSETDDTELCRRARTQHLDSVIVLADVDLRGANRVFNCP